MEAVRILGAGPSGLAAAINLAKEGHKVEVFEKGKKAGQRFRGDLQGLENWSKREDVLEDFKKNNIDINFDCNPFSSLVLVNGTETNGFHSDRPFFYTVRRGPSKGTLDSGLKEQAVSAGVEIKFGRTISEKKADIVATGPNLKETCSLARGVIFRATTDNVAAGIVNESAAPKGYSYLLVADGHGCMCSVLFDSFEKARECFAKTEKMFSKIMDLKIRNPKNFTGTGSFSLKGVYQRDGRIYIGEAAGIQDLLWGFGIRSAIVSGSLAAKCMTGEKDYEKAARNYFSRRLKASLVNRFIWEKFVTKRYPVLLEKAKDLTNPFDFLYKKHNFDITQKFLYPFALYYMRKRYRNLRL